jgi:hypothetical protein
MKTCSPFGGGHLGKVGEGGGPLPGVTIGGVGRPMIIVGERTAGEAQRLVAHFAKQVDRVGRVEVTIPDRRIETELTRVNGSHGLRCVHGKVDYRGGGLSSNRDTIHVKRRLRRTATILDPESRSGLLCTPSNASGTLIICQVLAARAGSVTTVCGVPFRVACTCSN